MLGTQCLLGNHGIGWIYQPQLLGMGILWNPGKLWKKRWKDPPLKADSATRQIPPGRYVHKKLWKINENHGIYNDFSRNFIVIQWDINGIYPLVNSHITMERSTHVQWVNHLFRLGHFQ